MTEKDVKWGTVICSENLSFFKALEVNKFDDCVGFNCDLENNDHVIEHIESLGGFDGHIKKCKVLEQDSATQYGQEMTNYFFFSDSKKDIKNFILGAKSVLHIVDDSVGDRHGIVKSKIKTISPDLKKIWYTYVGFSDAGVCPIQLVSETQSQTGMWYMWYDDSNTYGIDVSCTFGLHVHADGINFSSESKRDVKNFIAGVKVAKKVLKEIIRK